MMNLVLIWQTRRPLRQRTTFCTMRHSRRYYDLHKHVDPVHPKTHHGTLDFLRSGAGVRGKQQLFHKDFEPWVRPSKFVRGFVTTAGGRVEIWETCIVAWDIHNLHARAFTKSCLDTEFSYRLQVGERTHCSPILTHFVLIKVSTNLLAVVTLPDIGTTIHGVHAMLLKHGVQDQTKSKVATHISYLCNSYLLLRLSTLGIIYYLAFCLVLSTVLQ